ncbi:MAG TPA: hypothetical protein VK784_16915 [Pseudonocardiaceae bacterium]|nr:hypothetical protein [Pseudonocardiaceae bacterium]
MTTSSKEALARVRELVNAVRTVDVERRWMLSEPVLGIGYR